MQYILQPEEEPVLHLSQMADQDDWDVKMPCCEVAVNNTWSSATGRTPFSLTDPLCM